MAAGENKHMLEVIGARVHNLKNVDLSIPRYKLIVFTGLSGSGKSSLAFDTIYAEGQRRYMETFSAYARQFIGNLARPDVDKITGLSPVVSIEQKSVNKNPRSTVGTITEVYDFLRLLFARVADAYSHVSGEKMVKYTEEQIHALLLKEFTDETSDIAGIHNVQRDHEAGIPVGSRHYTLGKSGVHFVIGPSVMVFRILALVVGRNGCSQ
jgi:excinuclease ABC subunit A